MKFQDLEDQEITQERQSNDQMIMDFKYSYSNRCTQLYMQCMRNRTNNRDNISTMQGVISCPWKVDHPTLCNKVCESCAIMRGRECDKRTNVEFTNDEMQDKNYVQVDFSYTMYSNRMHTPRFIHDN